MITWPLAICIIFSTFIVSLFAFLTFVYIKEYKREEKAMKEFMKLRDSSMDLYMVSAPLPPPKKKSVVADIPDLKPKDKKNVN